MLPDMQVRYASERQRFDVEAVISFHKIHGVYSSTFGSCVGAVWSLARLDNDG